MFSCSIIIYMIRKNINGNLARILSQIIVALDDNIKNINDKLLSRRSLCT